MVTPAAANHTYWDPSDQPALYSNVRALNRAGYATLNIDPVGSGASSHPPSPLVTVESFLYQVHQLVHLLRAGEIGDTRFTRVVLHGLSNGAMVSAIVAGRYRDVDAIILHGFTHLLTPDAIAETGRVTEPAFLQQRYADRNLDPGYLAFNDYFYEHTMVSPNGYDRSSPNLYEYRDTLTAPYAFTLGVYLGVVTEPTHELSPTNRITAPVLVAVGSEDFTMCGPPPTGTDCTNAATVHAKVAPLYPNARRLDTFVLPRAGHVMNLALNARDWFAFQIRWLHEVVD